MKASMATAKQPTNPIKPDRSAVHTRTLVFGLGSSAQRQSSPRPAGLLPNCSRRSWTFVVGQTKPIRGHRPHDVGRRSGAS